MPGSRSWRRKRRGRSRITEIGNCKKRAVPEWVSPCNFSVQRIFGVFSSATAHPQRPRCTLDLPKVRELPCGNFCVGPGAWRGGLCGCNQSFLRRKGGGVLLGCLPCGSCHPSRDAEPDAARLKLWAQRGGGSPVLDTTNSPDDVSDGKASGCPVGPECSSRPGRPQRHDPQEKRNSSR